MKKYCRYCAFCFESDDFRCSNHPDGKQPHWTEEDIKKENHCKNFILSDLGCVITGRKYKPRDNVKANNDNKEKFHQLNFDEILVEQR